MMPNVSFCHSEWSEQSIIGLGVKDERLKVKGESTQLLQIANCSLPTVHCTLFIVFR